MMRVKVLRTGGFAGIALHAQIDTAQVEAFERGKIDRLVDEAAFFSLPARIETQESGYDRYQYEITVERDGTSHTVHCGDAGMSEQLRELVRLIILLHRRSSQGAPE